MAYLNSTQFSEQLSYVTLLIWIYRLEDMNIVRFAKEINKIKGVGLYCHTWDSNLGLTGGGSRHQPLGQLPVSCRIQTRRYMKQRQGVN